MLLTYITFEVTLDEYIFTDTLLLDVTYSRMTQQYQKRN